MLEALRTVISLSGARTIVSLFSVRNISNFINSPHTIFSFCYFCFKIRKFVLLIKQYSKFYYLYQNIANLVNYSK